MGLGSVTQMHPAGDRQQVLAIANVVRKLAHFRRISTSKDAFDLNMRIFCPGLFWEHRSVSERATVSDFRQELYRSLVANSIGYRIERREVRDRLIIID